VEKVLDINLENCSKNEYSRLLKENGALSVSKTTLKRSLQNQMKGSSTPNPSTPKAEESESSSKKETKKKVKPLQKYFHNFFYKLDYFVTSIIHHQALLVTGYGFAWLLWLP